MWLSLVELGEAFFTLVGFLVCMLMTATTCILWFMRSCMRRWVERRNVGPRLHVSDL